MILSAKTFCDLAEKGKIRLHVPMSKLNNAFGIIYYKSSLDKKKVVECTVEQYQTFKIKEGYKVIAKALDERYGSESFYVNDLLNLIESGHIKTTIKLN